MSGSKFRAIIDLARFLDGRNGRMAASLRLSCRIPDSQICTISIGELCVATREAIGSLLILKPRPIDAVQAQGLEVIFGLLILRELHTGRNRPPLPRSIGMCCARRNASDITAVCAAVFRPDGLPAGKQAQPPSMLDWRTPRLEKSRFRPQTIREYPTLLRWYRPRR